MNPMHRSRYLYPGNGDGSVTAADAAAILRYVVGLISVFPVQQP